jgi:tetratricopeptide (TPR) repeat protein
LRGGDRPVVLLSAGIGVTPVLAMLHALAKEPSARKVWWLHGARNGHEDSFAEEAQTLLKKLPDSRSHVRFSRPCPDDKPGVDFDAIGRLEMDALEHLGVSRESDFYVCGPTAFMRDFTAGLAAWGVPPERVHTEVFGSSDPVTPGILGADDPATLDTLASVARVLESEGKWSDAEGLWREAVAGWRKREDNGSHDLLYVTRGLGLAFEGEGRWADAETVWRESLDAWRKLEGIEGQQSMYTLRKLGLALEAEAKWPEAEAVHREAWGISRKHGDENPEALVDLERLVRVLVAAKKFAEAERLLDEALTPAFVALPASANLLIERFDIKGRRGRWLEAAADAALILDIQPTDHYRYHTLIALLAMAHDTVAYEELCKKLLTKFANPTNPYIAERMVQDSLLIPNSWMDLNSADKLADTALALGASDANLPYFQACKAMSMYRLGHYQEAIEWGERAARISVADAQAKAYAILAMAHWQLGQKDKAREALAQGDALAPIFSPASDTDELGEAENAPRRVFGAR